MIGDQVENSGALFVGPADGCGFNVVVVEETRCAFGGIDLVAAVVEHPAGLQHVHFATDIAGADEHGSLRYVMAYGDHGVEKCLFKITSQTAYFAGRRHVYTQNRVGFVQTGE